MNYVRPVTFLMRVSLADFLSDHLTSGPQKRDEQVKVLVEPFGFVKLCDSPKVLVSGIYAVKGGP